MVAGVYRPASHAAHVVWLSSYLPDAHGVHVVLALLTMEPSPQVLHISPLVSSEYSPAKHSPHFLAAEL